MRKAVNDKKQTKKKTGAPKGNQNAVGNNGGRPALYDTPESLQSMIDYYFNDKDRRITICGLAYFLGFASRQSLSDYENNVVFSDIIKRARLRVEMNYEECLAHNSPTGAIFALKNMGWVDRQELTGKNGDSLMPPTIVFKDFKNAGT